MKNVLNKGGSVKKKGVDDGKRDNDKKMKRQVKKRWLLEWKGKGKLLLMVWMPENYGNQGEDSNNVVFPLMGNYCC